MVKHYKREKTRRKEANMKTFTYTITDEMGIHARPAGLLVKEAKKYESIITISHGDKSADCTRLMAIMALGIKCGTQVSVSIEGPDEDDAAIKMETFFKENL